MFNRVVLILLAIVSPSIAFADGFKTDRSAGFKTDRRSHTDKSSDAAVSPLATVEALGLQETSSSEAIGSTEQTFQIIEPVSVQGHEQLVDEIVDDTFETVTYVADYCHFCHLMMQKWPRGSGRVRMLYSTDSPPKIWENGKWVVPLLPYTTWNDRSGTARYVIGYQTPEQLLARILSSDPPAPQRVSIPQPVGMPAIHDGGMIEKILEQSTAYFGNGAKILIQWKRQGGKQNLLFDESNSLEEILGTAAHVVCDINAPERSLKVHYEMDCVPSELKSHDGKAGSPLLLAWTLVSVANGIYEVLHPKVSLYLPETISVSAEMQGDHLAIDFGPTPPNVRLHWSFWLGLFQAEYSRPLTGLKISPKSVVVQFHQSKYYRDLTLEVSR